MNQFDTSSASESEEESDYEDHSFEVWTLPLTLTTFLSYLFLCDPSLLSVNFVVACRRMMTKTKWWVRVADDLGGCSRSFCYHARLVLLCSWPTVHWMFFGQLLQGALKRYRLQPKSLLAIECTFSNCSSCFGSGMIDCVAWSTRHTTPRIPTHTLQDGKEDTSEALVLLQRIPKHAEVTYICELGDWIGVLFLGLSRSPS